MSKPRIITARYSETCSDCGEPISPGEKINYVKGLPATHADCETAQPVFGTGVGARNGYAHWNEEADLIWWQEAGRFGE